MYTGIYGERKNERTKKKRNSEMARRRWAVPRGHIALSKGQIRRHTRNVYVRFCCCFFFRFELGKGICEQVAEWGMWFKSNAGLSCCRLSRFTTDVLDILGRYKKKTVSSCSRIVCRREAIPSSAMFRARHLANPINQQRRRIWRLDFVTQF